MTRTYFDKELELLHVELIRMGAMIEDAITDSIRALNTHDYELAREIVENDRNVDEIEQDIETRCLRLLWHQQPVAKDLRAVTTAVKMITDMERIGDQAADIADIALHKHIENLSAFAPSIPKMAEIAIDMVKKSINSFINGDLELAQSTKEKDDEVDNLFEVAKEQLIAMIKEDASYANAVIDALMVAKYLERIGDHAVNICEWVEFYQTGVRNDRQIL